MYGRRASNMPIAHVFVSAATVRPAPIAKATHWTPGTKTLTKYADGNDQPGDQADLPLEVPTLGSPVDVETLALPGRDTAVEDVHVGQAGSAAAFRRPGRRADRTCRSIPRLGRDA